MSYKRGDIFYAYFDGFGSEQSGERPCVIIQNNVGNHYSNTTIVALITKTTKNNYLPVHVPIKKESANLKYDSVIMTEQIRTIDKKRLRKKVATLSKEIMDKVSLSIATSILTDSGERVTDVDIKSKNNDNIIA